MKTKLVFSDISRPEEKEFQMVAGAIFTHQDSSLYMLTQIDTCVYTLVGLATGNRWSRGVKDGSPIDTPLISSTTWDELARDQFQPYARDFSELMSMLQ
jgi:hypothetical protein